MTWKTYMVITNNVIIILFLDTKIWMANENSDYQLHIYVPSKKEIFLHIYVMHTFQTKRSPHGVQQRRSIIILKHTNWIFILRKKKRLYLYFIIIYIFHHDCGNGLTKAPFKGFFFYFIIEFRLNYLYEQTVFFNSFIT